MMAPPLYGPRTRHMRPSLRLKLFLTLLLTTAVVVALMFLVMQWSFERGFVRLVEERQRDRLERVVAALTAEHAAAGGWQRLRGDPRRWASVVLEARAPGRARPERWLRLLGRTPPGVWPPPRAARRATERGEDDDHEGRGRGHGEDDEAWEHAMRASGDGPAPFGFRLPLELRLMLLDAEGRVVVGRTDWAGRLERMPVEASGRQVGYLGVLPGPELEALADIRFVDRQKRAFVVIAAVVVLLAGLAALPLASAMSTRLERIARGARALAQGRYDERVPVHGGDELGRLAVDFNELAAALERTEHSRRQWVADVSHELRTPLALLRAELEALQDGVRALDATALETLHADVLRLARLVDDLYDLARSDLGALSYHKAPLDPVALFEDDLEALAGEFRERRIETALEREGAGHWRVHGDADRLSQLYRNLLTNTLRYTDPGGRLRVRARCDGGELQLDFEDSSPGVPAADLPRLFERFHRVERSRSRELGGAGLGLAICRSIAEAHGGRLQARDSSLGGLCVRLCLPVLT
jgi:two-component system sensor histidine kinase BaeS